jgi:flagellar protein FlgJ
MDLDAGSSSALVSAGRTASGRSDQADPAEVRRQLVEAGRQFEAFFISYLLKVMRETVPEGAIENKRGAYFHSFYDQEIGVRAAEAGGLGIGNMVRAYAEHNLGLRPGTPSSFSRSEPIRDRPEG